MASIIPSLGLIFIGPCWNMIQCELCWTSWSLQTSQGNKPWAKTVMTARERGREKCHETHGCQTFCPRGRNKTEKGPLINITQKGSAQACLRWGAGAAEEASPLLHTLCLLPLAKRLLTKTRPDLVGSEL